MGTLLDELQDVEDAPCFRTIEEMLFLRLLYSLIAVGIHNQQKLIKELPSLVPSEDPGKSSEAGIGAAGKADSVDKSSSCARESLIFTGSPATVRTTKGQNRGDATSEAKRLPPAPVDSGQVVSVPSEPEARGGQRHSQGPRSDLDTIGRSPGEIAFFKLLHAEFKKATHFFERAQEEYMIREERVRKGMDIMKQPNSIMVGEKWSLLAKSIYRLYKDLLLLETFAIMTYCGFSKILKKHDKVTGYHTREPFMASIVNKANFTNYPRVLEMISRCEQLYEEVSERLVQDGQHGLYEDERLFINMIHRLNEQVMEGVDVEGAPGRMELRRQSISMPNVSATSKSKESWATSSLRQLVNENDARSQAGQVSESNECNPGAESDGEGEKRKQRACGAGGSTARKRKTEDHSNADVMSEQKQAKNRYN